MQREKIKDNGAGEKGLEGFDCLVEEIAGYLVVDVHDIADLFVAEILKVFEINDLFLAAGEAVEGVEDFPLILGALFESDEVIFMAPFKNTLILADREDTTAPTV